MKTLDDIEIIEQIPPVFPSDAWVSIDLEVFGMAKGKFHRPVGTFASLALTADGHTVYVITDQMYLGILDRTFEEHCGIIGQNLPFDIRQLRRWVNFPAREKIHDTMLFERILWGGFYDGASLKDLARRYLGIYLEKEPAKLYEKATTLDAEKVRYNAVDAAIQWLVAQEQMKLAKKSHMKVWREIDMPAMWAFLDFKGALIDVQKWEQVALGNQSDAEGIAEEFGFNPRSPKQVKDYLNGIGVAVTSTGAAVLEKHKENETVAKLLAYRKVEKQRSTYGMSWLNRYVEEDCRVYTSYDVNRAESGRTSSSSPNVQQIPVRDTPVFRECFIAAPGYVLVGGDFGQQEIRVAAYLSQDDNLIELLRSERDIYSEIASYIYKEHIEKSDPRRQKTKSVVLGIIYGLSPFGLARDVGCTEEEAEELFAVFFKHFSKVAIWMDKQQEKVNSFVRTPAGRKCWINPYSSQAKRNVLNSPCQGGAADMMKRSVALLHQRWDHRKEPFPAILQIHDEIQMEVKQENEEYAKEILRECMVEAGEFVIPGVRIAVDISSGANWALTH